MKKYMWLLLVVLFIIGGCGINNDQEKNVSPLEMNAEDLPDVPALQDEFTREFIQSTEPVREGFYPFLSKSKSFTMDFPEEMVVNYKFHNIGPNNRSETITFSHIDRGEEVFLNFSLDYYKGEPIEENVEDRISKSHGEDLEFKKIKTENDTTLSVADYKFNEQLYNIAGFSWNEIGNIDISISLRCNDILDSEDCQKQIINHKEKVIELLKTINIVTIEEE
ncbi:hypothetical protein [Oceanobacillus sp. 1P07AA]|uniref:hypothetical protein n=1 Tax=Oceanobacillus sp. 1P07AA TaxID=3132293 RepID=UPI0039A60424